MASNEQAQKCEVKIEKAFVNLDQQFRELIPVMQQQAKETAAAASAAAA